MMQLPKKKGIDFNEMFKGVSPLAIDLIKRILVFDPAKRITVE
jgi:mitogen-activated protein kinase 1/3